MGKPCFTKWCWNNSKEGECWQFWWNLDQCEDRTLKEKKVKT